MRLIVPAVFVVAVLCGACSAQPPEPPSTTTTAVPSSTVTTAGDVATALTILDQEMAPGCPGSATGPACTGHVTAVVQRVHDLRWAMGHSATPTFYSPCFVLMDQVDRFAGGSDAASQTAALAAVIRVQDWARQHPAG